MSDIPYANALIVGAGPGISASVARALSAAGLKVALAARNTEKLQGLAAETGAALIAADASDPASVERLFAEADDRIGAPEVVVFNAAARVRGRIVDIEAADVRRAIEVSAFGGFLVTQAAAKRMVPKNKGAILLTGATASVKGFALSSGFAMGKFALRGLAQSAARELGPQGVHVVHFVIDGGVRSAIRPDPNDAPDSTLNPDGVAVSYLAALRQPRDAWSWEIELRPWVERF
ncbi:MAG TPA: SDR family NAD(P)-dependent oxidoreductase [Caulobacteraceae bacterium]|jgi:NAD(P)-dependent dehydrogenase (short-subunit alcohol dehydrogenase family)